MNSKAGLGRWLAAVAALAFVVAACGSTSTPTATSKGTVTIGGFAFTEGSVLAELYGQALKHDGYDVKFRLNLGNREVVVKVAKILDEISAQSVADQRGSAAGLDT